MTATTADVTAGTKNPFDQILNADGEPTPPNGTSADVEPDEAEDSDDAEGGEEPDEALGDKGKQALERMKARLREERAKRRAAEQQLAEHADVDDAARIRREAEHAAITKANGRIVRAEVRAAAAAQLTDPADALNFLDLDQFEVDDDGRVDQDEIAHAIADLLERKPYLAAQGGTKSPRPDRSQGAGEGKGTATVEQRFAADLARAGF